MRIEIIPEHAEHIDCPKCAKVFIKQIIEGKTTNPKCDVCGGEGVLRADGEPTLKTRITNYIQPQFRSGSFDGEIQKKGDPND